MALALMVTTRLWLGGAVSQSRDRSLIERLVAMVAGCASFGPLLFVSDVTCPPKCGLQATHPGHVWTYDFVHDACRTGTPLKVLTVMDEFTREGLAIEVPSSMPSAKVIRVLGQLFHTHGAPEFLRSDNGPEFVALAVRSYLAQHQTATLYIDPGCPWQNGYEERFNGTVRDECLNLYAFHTVAEARVVCGAYLREYNDERPHSSLGYRTPAEFKQEWLERQSQATGL
jgi:putative transposase